MFEFYRDNVKYYLRIAFYRYVPHLLLASLVFIFSSIVLGGVLLLKPAIIGSKLLKIAIVSIAISPIVIGLLLLLYFSLKLFFITGYSFTKYLTDENKLGKRFWSLIKRFITSPKIVILSLFFIILGYVTYDRILPGILQSTDEIVINRVIFSVALTLLIYSVLFLFIIRRFFVRLTKALWDYLPGLAWKVLVALTIISSQFVILAAIYLVVYMLLVPRFF